MDGPSKNIKLIDDIKAQLDALNTLLSTAKKEAKALEKELQKAAKAGQALDPAKLNRLAQLKNTVGTAQQQQQVLQGALASAKGKEALGHAIVHAFTHTRDVADKVANIVSSKAVKNAFYGGEVRGGDVGEFLGKIASTIPGPYGKAAQILIGGVTAGFKASDAIQDTQRAYGRGEISRQELALLEEKAGQGTAGLRNFFSLNGMLFQNQEERQQELLANTKEFSSLSNLGRNRLNELYRQQGVKGDAGELLNRIHRQENLLEKRLGRGLTDEERAKAARAGAAEEIEKGGISERDVIRIINSQKLHEIHKPPPPVINMQQRREWEQASIRQSIRRVPFKIKD